MSLAASAFRRRPFRPRYEYLAWLAPLVVFLIVGVSPIIGLPVIVAGCVAIAGVFVLSRYPGVALVSLVWFLPLQIPLFSWLYKQGVPGNLLRQGGAIKEVLAVAVLVAAARQIFSGRSRLDRLDKLILAYVGALVVYLFLPMVVSSATYPHTFSDRLLGFRLDGGFLLLFVATRHAPINERWRHRFLASVIGVAVLFAAVGIYQFVSPTSFTDFIQDSVGVPQFHLDVLKTPFAEVVQLMRWTTTRPVRVGSLFVGPFDFADFLILPAALLLVRVTRGRAHFRAMAFLGLVGGAIVASQTRANMVALVVIALLAFTPAPQRVLANRLRLLAIVALALVAFIPSLVSTRLGGAGESGQSSQGHVNEIQGGIETVVDQPLGTGLGTAPALAVRLEGAPLIISDNSILQVGNELGAGMMVFFVVLLIAVVLHLGRANRDDPPDGLASAARLALIGLLLAGQFHHVFQIFAITWPLWIAAGLALAPARRREDGSVPSHRSADATSDAA